MTQGWTLWPHLPPFPSGPGGLGAEVSCAKWHSAGSGLTGQLDRRHQRRFCGFRPVGPCPQSLLERKGPAEKADAGCKRWPRQTDTFRLVTSAHPSERPALPRMRQQQQLSSRTSCPGKTSAPNSYVTPRLGALPSLLQAHRPNRPRLSGQVLQGVPCRVCGRRWLSRGRPLSRGPRHSLPGEEPEGGQAGGPRRERRAWALTQCGGGHCESLHSSPQGVEPPPRLFEHSRGSINKHVCFFLFLSFLFFFED